MMFPCKPVRIGSSWLCVAVLLTATRALALEVESGGKSFFEVKVEMFSIEAGHEGQAADKYRYQGSGTAGPGGCLGLAVSLPNGTFTVNIVHKKKAGCHVHVTGDFRNYFQERIDRISQPQIQYIRPGYISTRHPNHGANVRYPSRSNWRRETYLARKRQSATDLVSTQ